jgi:hypothetical protein
MNARGSGEGWWEGREGKDMGGGGEERGGGKSMSTKSIPGPDTKAIAGALFY